MRFSAINPIRFVQVTAQNKEFVNWNNVFPNGDNQLNENFYYKNNFPAYFSPIFKRDSLDFQIQSATQYATPSTDIVITAKDLSGQTYNLSYTVTEITPEDWAEGFGYERYIYEVHITPISSYKGCIRLFLNDSSEYWISEPMRVHSYMEGLLKVEYSNTENDYGMLFVGDSKSFSYKFYIDAQFIPSSGGSRSTYANDRARLEIVRGTPQQVWDIAFDYLPWWFVNKLDYLMYCDTVKFNDVLVATENGIEKEQLNPYYTGYSGSMSVVQQEFDMRDTQTTIYTQVIADDNNESLIDDNDEYLIN